MTYRGRDEDTICALSTPPGRGGLAVLRLSGGRALEMGRKVATFLPVHPETHRIYYGRIFDHSGQLIDDVLISYFAEGRSYTADETLEISCHGSQAIVAAILEELVSLGARPADRGEFTYRAFMHGRIDLVQAESVLTLIESETKQAAHLAARQLQGDLSREINCIEGDLTWILAHMEAGIDFSTEDIDPYEPKDLVDRAQESLQRVEVLLRSYQKGRLLSEGFHVALVGPPNVGKSSLLNALCGEEKAIVTEVAGTTRDAIQAQLMIEGVKVLLTDTAGLRATEDQIEKMGISRTHSVADQADALFYVVDALQPLEAQLQDLHRYSVDRVFKVFNKVDALNGAQIPDGFAAVSAQTGQGLEILRDFIGQKVRHSPLDEAPVISNSRQLEKLQTVEKALKMTMKLLYENSSPEFIAFELQSGLHAVHELLGREFDDQVMDRVFNEFCIGK